jgi:hypothetical protein
MWGSRLLPAALAAALTCVAAGCGSGNAAIASARAAAADVAAAPAGSRVAHPVPVSVVVTVTGTGLPAGPLGCTATLTGTVDLATGSETLAHAVVAPAAPTYPAPPHGGSVVPDPPLGPLVGCVPDAAALAALRPGSLLAALSRAAGARTIGPARIDGTATTEVEVGYPAATATPLSALLDVPVAQDPPVTVDLWLGRSDRLVRYLAQTDLGALEARLLAPGAASAPTTVPVTLQVSVQEDLVDQIPAARSAPAKGSVSGGGATG